MSGKGFHLAFRDSAPRGNAKFEFGRLRGDVRGSAGYVVLPDAERQAFLAVCDDLPYRPEQDLSVLFPERAAPLERVVTSQTEDSAWSVSALSRVRAAVNGSRNNTLFKVACEGYRRGLPDNWFIELKSFSSLQFDESERTVASARKAVLGAGA